MNELAKIWSLIAGFFVGPVWNFIKPTVELVESEGGNILVNAAENAVVAGFATVGGGSAAMAAALASFTAEVTAKGLPFIESQARLLIEAALQKAKSASVVVPGVPLADSAPVA